MAELGGIGSRKDPGPSPGKQHPISGKPVRVFGHIWAGHSPNTTLSREQTLTFGYVELARHWPSVAKRNAMKSNRGLAKVGLMLSQFGNLGSIATRWLVSHCCYARGTKRVQGRTIVQHPLPHQLHAKTPVITPIGEHWESSQPHVARTLSSSNTANGPCMPFSGSTPWLPSATRFNNAPPWGQRSIDTDQSQRKDPHLRRWKVKRRRTSGHSPQKPCQANMA